MFIVLDGVEGSGKTTQIRLLAQALRDATGREVVETREPGGGGDGAMAIRQLLVTGDPHKFDARTEMLMFAAARNEHLRKLVIPALDRGAIVVCDRYVSSTLAYQGHGHGRDIETILAIHRVCNDDVWPDLTVIIDVDPIHGLRRSTKRLAEEGSDEDRFERLGGEFHRRAASGFREMAEKWPRRFTLVDGAGSIAEVQGRVLAAVAHRMAGGQNGEIELAQDTAGLALGATARVLSGAIDDASISPYAARPFTGIVDAVSCDGTLHLRLDTTGFDVLIHLDVPVGVTRIFYDPSARRYVDPAWRQQASRLLGKTVPVPGACLSGVVEKVTTSGAIVCTEDGKKWSLWPEDFQT